MRHFAKRYRVTFMVDGAVFDCVEFASMSAAWKSLETLGDKYAPCSAIGSVFWEKL